MRRGLRVAGLVLSVGIMIFMSALESQALTIGFCDGDLPGTCSKSVSLSGGTLSITLTNTSPAANGGFITADAFNLAGAASVTSFATTNGNFSLVSGPINVAPDGTREFVITATPGAQPYLGGGSPKGGIAVGNSATFTLGLGGNISGVTEANVFSSQLVRFRGFADGGSDKDHTTPGGAVPIPGSFFLFGIGLAGFVSWHLKSDRRS